jgi:hypothetical protein
MPLTHAHQLEKRWTMNKEERKPTYKQKEKQERKQAHKQKRQERKQSRQQKRQAKKVYVKNLSVPKKIIRYTMLTIAFFAVVIFMLSSIGTVAYATGLVDETINASNEYSKYGLSHYQLDFYVDNSWGWLPWNWSDGLGKSVMYGLYAITNFIWTISLYLSNATGYLVGEAYSLDFISQTSNAIGENIQTIAGVTRNGFSSSGFYVGFLLIFVLILGIYVTYTGLIKRETTKAVQAILNFVLVFILSASFIAYAPDYVGRINDFSKDISQASLDVGTRIVLPNSNTRGQNSVDMIRDSLFAIQVKQPWLLLQYGTTGIDNSRVEALLSISPDTNNGEDREKAVIDEIENQDNNNLTITKTINRLGTVFFLFFFNIGISIFVFLLTGIMIFSQVLFIIFAMFLPISFLLSMIPSFEGMAKKAITRLFNVIMARAGITLIITVAFSISTMLYTLAGSSPFFLVMFLQIVTFAGIYFKLGDLMGMFALQSGDSQNMGQRMLRKPRMFMHRQTRRLQRSMNKAFRGNATSAMKQGTSPHTAKGAKANHERSNGYTGNTNGASATRENTASHTPQPRSFGKQAGEKVAHVMDTKNRMMDKAVDVKDNIKHAPTNAKYAIHKGKRDLVRNAQDFTRSVSDTKERKQEERANARSNKRAGLARKRLEMDRARQDKDKTEPNASMRNHKRDYEKRQQSVPPKRTNAPQASTTPSSTAKTDTSRPITTPARTQEARSNTTSPTNKQVNAKPSPVSKNPQMRPSAPTTASQKEQSKTSKQATRTTSTTKGKGRKL